MQNNFTKIAFEKEYSSQFCICTIVTDVEEYSLMKTSFENAGFNAACEYLIADNTIGNIFDGYNAIRRFLQESKARYTIIVHQDVRCQDNIKMLLECLNDLNTKDNNWALCGNAGGANYNNIVYHINNNGIRKTEGLPQRVFSLDENFLIVKTEKQMAVSSDIEGFHYYGTDLCIVADFLGYTSYVIPFMVEHLSKGNLRDLELKKPTFLKAFGKKLRPRFIQTSCDKFYLGNSETQNKLYNSEFVFFWIKAKKNILKLLKISQ
jgi:hypothetical protein